MFNPVIPTPRSAQYSEGFMKKGSRVSKKLDTTLTQPEAYKISVTETACTVFAGGDEGFFRAETTLKQLYTALGGYPVCEIDDAPRYPYRGFMLDCCRHFFSVADIKKMVEGASLFKMNVMRWHLSDDQGWRVQIDKYPRLTEIGSTRATSTFGRTPEPGPHSGFFTKAQIREVVDFCKQHFIEVIPEIEIPGHASALLAAYPQLTCTGEPVEIKTNGGIFPDLVCAGNDAVLDFLRDVLDEVCELFPSARFHIGGDEAPKDSWKACPKCQKRMRELGLKDENALAVWLANELAAHLKKRGKTAIVWNDVLRGGEVDKDTIVEFWRKDEKLAQSYLENGGSLIVSDFTHLYLDYPYGQTPLNKTLGFTLPFNVPDEARERVLGLEAPLWAEHIRTLERLSYLAFPRLAAVAETAWAGFEGRVKDDFERRFTPLEKTLVGMGLTIAPHEDWNMRGAKKLRDVYAFWHNAATKQNIRAALGLGKKKKKA